MAVFGVPAARGRRASRLPGGGRDARRLRRARNQRPDRRQYGRVVTGTAERLATGDAVNVAARLEQAAAPGEVLIAAETLALAGGAVVAEPVEPLTLKGKSEPVPAFRLISTTASSPAASRPRWSAANRAQAAPGRVCPGGHDRSCQLFTVLGSAGVGKSRLAAEFLAPRGPGGTGPLPVLRRGDHVLAGGRDRQAAPGAARGRCSRAASVAARRDGPATSAEEIAWGFRKLIEQEAQEHPLICVFDDLHWGRGDPARSGRACRGPIPRRSRPRRAPPLLSYTRTRPGQRIHTTACLGAPKRDPVASAFFSGEGFVRADFKPVELHS